MRSTRKTRIAHRKLLVGVIAAVFAIGIAVPALALATEVTYQTTEDGSEITQTGAFSDDSAGISWDGADTVTLSNATLYMVDITGDAVIKLVGESNVSYLYADGDLTIEGNKDAAASEKPVLNLVGDEAYDYAEIEAGSLKVEGATVNVDAEDLCVVVDDGITIDNSKLATTNPEGSSITLDGTDVTVTESEVDLGTGGGIIGADSLTIDNSNVTNRYLGGAVKTIHGGEVALTNMANGETIAYEDPWYSVTQNYITTGDDDGVYLLATGTPGYYEGSSDSSPDIPSGGGGADPGDDPAGGDTPSGGAGGSSAVPATGDANMAVAMMCLAMFVCSLGALGVVRRRVEE